MKLLTRFLPLTLVVLVSIGYRSANAQISSTKLESQFNDYQGKVLQEKLYMHVDRNFYLAGDIVWFKLYVVDATLHQPLDVSKVAYVEIVDENHIPALQAKISLTEGKGNGSFSLPVSIVSGNYKIRAYTNWMKNFGAEYFFEKDLTVVNTQKSRDIIQKVSNSIPVPDIHFFPEGGNLVRGIASKVACRVQMPDGKGAAFSGAILNERNDTILRFTSGRLGMGSFEFTPEAGHSYKAVIRSGSETYTKELPEVFEQGYVMRLKDEGKNVQVTVQTRNAGADPVYLLVHTRQSLKATVQLQTINGQGSYTIEKDKLGDGISTFTIFNNAGKPVCERLWFTYPRQELSIAVSANKTQYDTRSKIDLSLLPVDETGKPSDADMSLAVYRADEFQGMDKNNIQAFLLLSSDLKGKVESPEFYFGTDTLAAHAAMDNLMLTQGWRRFHWDDVLENKKPALQFIPEVNGHIFNGRVISTVTGKPVENIETYLSVPGANSNVLASISQADGRVLFDVNHFRGSQEVVVQTSPFAPDTLVRFEITNPFYENFSQSQFAPFRLLKAIEKPLLDESIGVQVQNVYAGNMLRRFTKVIDTASTLGPADAVYFLDDFTRFSTTEEVMREYVELISVKRKGDLFSFQVIDNFAPPFAGLADRKLFEGNPLILIDGVPILHVSKIMDIDPLKLRKLEVYNRRYFIGNSFFSGILSWGTYKNDVANFELDSRTLVIDYEGMQLQREFYSPVYENAASTTRVPDYRTLLYWSPSVNVSADTKGLKHIQFYSSDRKGDFVVVVQGLSSTGRAGSAITQFEVK